MHVHDPAFSVQFLELAKEEDQVKIVYIALCIAIAKYEVKVFFMRPVLCPAGASKPIKSMNNTID